MSDKKFISMIRATFEYIFTVVPRTGWKIGIDTPKRGIAAYNGDLWLCVSNIDGVFVHVMDDSRKYSYTILKLYIYHHEKDCDYTKERKEERRLFKIAVDEVREILSKGMEKEK